MPLSANLNPFITCAVTGSGSSQDRSPHVPRSPEQIASSAIDAARAGAAVVHCHVREPDTGKPSRRVELLSIVSAILKPMLSSTSPPAWGATWYLATRRIRYP
jgi:uncharacterized protein (DUF849 family)